MIYTEMTKKAMKIAYRAHKGQKDSSGVPYIFHPMHLAEQMRDEVSTCAALLHDVVENTDWTIEDLERAFPPEVTEAVRLLTHEKHTPYLAYVRALAENPVARAVKLADLAHNSDESRFAGCSQRKIEKMKARKEKYARAREILLEKARESDGGKRA